MKTIAYWLGCKISVPMEKFDWAWLYPIYNRLMTYGMDGDWWIRSATPPYTRNPPTA